MRRFFRLFDASMLLDKIRTAIYNHAAERPFHMEEIMLTVDTSTKLQSIIMGEIGDVNEVYSGGLGLCNMWVEASLLSTMPKFRNGNVGADISTAAS